MSVVNRKSLQALICARLNKSPAVVMLGARQVGKTTLARQIATNFHQTATSYFDLEKSEDITALSNTPELVLRASQGLVVIDEIQRLPLLFERLRPICDDTDQMKKFLLLGSASWDLVSGVSESLAGRVLFVDITGFSIKETGIARQNRLWLRGGFPRAYCAGNDTDAFIWLDSFRRTFLERDIPGLPSKVAPKALGRFWNMLAHYHGQVWNAARLAESLSLDTRSVNHYRDLLAGTFMLRVLQPWSANIRKRQVKSPKIYIRDSGIMHHLLGLRSMSELQYHPMYGASWEGFALEQILMIHGERDSYFWATQRGAELDLLLLRGGKRWGFECKCSDAPTIKKSMRIALQDLQLEHLWVVYPGRKQYPLDEKITALPLRAIHKATRVLFGSKK